MTDPTVVVTGAGGYLGRELVRRLGEAGIRVRGVTRSSIVPAWPGVSVIRGDVRDLQTMAVACRGADAVFHLAAHAHDLRSVDDSADQQAVTLGGTAVTLSAAEMVGVRDFVFASSLAVHGPVGSGPADEGHPCHPTTPYGRAKLSAEELVRDFAIRTGASAAIIRPAMIYGVGCPGNLPRMIRAVQLGLFPPIPEFGNVRSMVWVGDVADAMIRAWRSNVADGRPYIITDGQGYSTRQIYDHIRAALGKSKMRAHIPRAVFAGLARIGDLAGAVLGRRIGFDSMSFDRIAGSAYFKSDRATQELGFHPTTTLPETIPKMIRID